MRAWNKSPGRRIATAVVIGLVIFGVVTPTSALAVDPHENPNTSTQVFSGVSLFRYYADTLDFVLSMNLDEVRARLEKMPFANVPHILEPARGNFASMGIRLSLLLPSIDEDLSGVRALLEQSRFDEAAELGGKAFGKLSQVRTDLDQIEQFTAAAARILNVFSTLEGSELRTAYNDVLDRISKIKQMRDVYQEVATGLLPVPEQKPLNPTELTLRIEPAAAFVGDNVSFGGELNTRGRPLAGKEVVILANGSRYVTVKTDSGGSYQGILSVPYRYVPDLNVQALYYPRDDDIGQYISSLSPVAKLRVLFYEARLEVVPGGKAYPGLETSITGKFDYGKSPLLRERPVEVYIDDVLVARVAAQEVFKVELRLDPRLNVGKHTLSLAAAAAGRYSPVLASATLDVTRATPILDMKTPGVALIPGDIDLGGRLYSEVSPVVAASIRVGLGKSQVQLVGSDDGVFAVRVKMGMDFGLIGSLNLEVAVIPQEPWHAPLRSTSRILVVNWVNCVSSLVILIFLGVYLPGRMKRRLGARPGKGLETGVAVAPPQPAQTYVIGATVPASAEADDQSRAEPRNRVFDWYRFVVRVLQRITKASLLPGQTLREFASESSRVLGPGVKYLQELTAMVERLLYSTQGATEDDVEKSQQLSHRIEEEARLRVTTQPLLAVAIGEGGAPEFSPGAVFVAGRAEESVSGGTVPATDPWRQLHVWLWVILILAVTDYAVILLYVLPLALASRTP